MELPATGGLSGSITMSLSSRPARIGAQRLYLGDRHQAKDRGLLRELQIQSVVNCTPPRTVDPSAGCANFFEQEALMHYHRVPIFDTQAEDATGYLAGAAKFIESRLHYGGVLVHCNRGISRSATFVVAYLMRAHGLGVDDALALVRTTRPAAKPNDAFMAQLRAHQATLEADREAAAKRKGAAPAPAPEARAPDVDAKQEARTLGPARGPPAAPARPERAPTAPATRPERSSIGPAGPPPQATGQKRPAAGPAPRPAAAGPAPRPSEPSSAKRPKPA